MTASKFTFRPGSLSNVKDEHLKVELDRYIGRIYDGHASLNSTAVKAPAFGAGFATNSGNEIVTGSKLGVPTGLSTVNHVATSVSTGSTPNAYTTSAGPSATVAGAIDIFVFQPTAAGDTTPIAATAAVLIHWIATGQAETTT